MIEAAVRTFEFPIRLYLFCSVEGSAPPRLVPARSNMPNHSDAEFSLARRNLQSSVTDPQPLGATKAAKRVLDMSPQSLAGTKAAKHVEDAHRHGATAELRKDLSSSGSSAGSCCNSTCAGGLSCDATSSPTTSDQECCPSMFALPSPPRECTATEYIHGLHAAIEHCIVRRLTLEQSVDSLYEVGWHPQLCRRIWAELVAQNRSFFAQYESECLAQF